MSSLMIDTAAHTGDSPRPLSTFTRVPALANGPPILSVSQSDGYCSPLVERFSRRFQNATAPPDQSSS
jgi:hypothetical protein